MSIIYKITNKINGKIYVGETNRTLKARWEQHLRRANQKNTTEYLYNAMRKYGIENFYIEEITQCKPEERFEVETSYIIKFKEKSRKKY